MKENEGGSGTVAMNWMEFGTRKDNARMNHSPELLKSDFDTKMNGVMFNDNNTVDKAQPIWWDGKDIRFDTPPVKKADPTVRVNVRETEKKN